jgi:bacterioferritin-associated ferredoxin
MREVKRQARVISGVTAVAADGDGRLEAVRYRRGERPETAIQTDLLMLHQGVAPNINLVNAIGCEHHWNQTQHCFVPATDPWGMSTVPGISIAGDGAGIGGAVAAEHRGRLAALDAAHRLGRTDQNARDKAAVPHRAALVRAERGRPFLDLLYRPGAVFRMPRGDTLVCRCEEVTARQVEEVIARGCPGPNQLKALLRCGMGPCQGRLCGLTVTEMIAEARGQSPAEIGHYRLRPPVKPITVAELASLPQTEAAQKAVAGD